MFVSHFDYGIRLDGKITANQGHYHTPVQMYSLLETQISFHSRGHLISAMSLVKLIWSERKHHQQ